MSLLYPYLSICKFPDGRAGDVRLLRVRRTLFTRITLPAEAVLPRKPVRAMAKLNRTHYSYKITGVTPVAMKFRCQGLELAPSGSAADVECNEPPQPRAQPSAGRCAQDGNGGIPNEMLGSVSTPFLLPSPSAEKLTDGWQNAEDKHLSLWDACSSSVWAGPGVAHTVKTTSPCAGGSQLTRQYLSLSHRLSPPRVPFGD